MLVPLSIYYIIYNSKTKNVQRNQMSIYYFPVYTYFYRKDTAFVIRGIYGFARYTPFLVVYTYQATLEASTLESIN
jgi:hypothetical protein